MKKSTMIFASVFIVMLAGFYSCSKTGATGPAGVAGTANVMYSTWSPLSTVYNVADSAYEQIITADSITQAILDSGLVLSYIRYTNSSGLEQVENADNYLEAIYSLQNIHLYSYNFDLTGVPFRYVVVRGGSNITGRVADAGTLIQGYTKAQWKAMDYNKVMTLLGMN